MRRVGNDGRIEKNMNILLIFAMTLAVAGVLLFSYVTSFRFTYHLSNRPLGDHVLKRLNRYDEKNYTPGDRRLLLVSAILFGLGLILIIILREVG